jgi:hypothetical protein
MVRVAPYAQYHSYVWANIGIVKEVEVDEPARGRPTSDSHDLLCWG